MTADGSLQRMNRAGLEMIEANSFDQVRGQCVYPLITEEYREAFKSLTNDVFSGKSGTLEFKMIGLKGRPLWLYTHAVPLQNEKKEIVLMLATTIDITDRKLAEERLRESENFIRNILDTVDEGFIVIDKDFRILTANKAYCSQTGKICDDVIGRHCYEISHKTNRPCYEEGEECAVQQVFTNGEPHAVLHKHLDQDGHILYVGTKAFPIKDTSGNVTSVIETINNITEKYLIEEERLKTQKLEAIGTLAGGIAHDFNNLLMGVFGYISMAKTKTNDPEETISMLEHAEKALKMSVNLTHQLLTFSKGGTPVKNRIALHSVINNSVKFALSGSRTKFKIDIDEGLCAVEADEGQISQVIQNIVLNADQAMPQGGVVMLKAKNIEMPGYSNMLPLARGRYVEIAIQDNGIGIPEELMPKIFDPYFTTKQKGSGLGLATSYSIVKNHGGMINVKSEPGKGSTFYIYLPAIEAEQQEEIRPAIASILRKGKILIMDDEDVVRIVTSKMIKDLGHEIETAEHGEEAIEKYRKAKDSGKPFDIVILDLTVRGGMGGQDAIQELLRLDSGVKAIVSSGYSEDAIMSDFKSHGFKAYLTKPYDQATLRDMLNTLL
ncbi:MAG: PAS domain S-box protein [Thermodesulfovibrionales bacterium]|nr:PAS domain S-box protein [Thermodesulfovibrionales bacterium]